MDPQEAAGNEPSDPEVRHEHPGFPRVTKMGGQTSTRFAVDFFHPLLWTHTFPLCCLPEQTNVISLGKLERLFSSQPFPLSESSPFRSLQQSAPNPQILSLPAGRAETLPVPSPSPPTTLIHQIPWPCSPPPAPTAAILAPDVH